MHYTVIFRQNQFPILNMNSSTLDYNAFFLMILSKQWEEAAEENLSVLRTISQIHNFSP